MSEPASLRRRALCSISPAGNQASICGGFLHAQHSPLICVAPQPEPSARAQGLCSMPTTPSYKMMYVSCDQTENLAFDHEVVKLGTGQVIDADHVAVCVCRIADVENAVLPQLVN